MGLNATYKIKLSTQYKTMAKVSHNAKAYARDIITTVRNGQKVKKGEIALKNGYSLSMSKHPQRIERTKSYQEEINSALDIMINERNRLLREMSRRQLGQLKYSTMSEVVKNFTHDAQLLGGGATERISNTTADELAGLIRDIRGIKQAQGEEIQKELPQEEREGNYPFRGEVELHGNEVDGEAQEVSETSAK